MTEERHCHRCTATAASRERCKLWTCATGPYCWIHTRKLQHLRVKQSGIHGKGLFADDPAAGQRAVIFNRNATISDYLGERNNARQAKRSRSAYIVGAGEGVFIDGAKTDSSVARYANDCRGTGKACNAMLWSAARGRPPRVWLRAQKRIRNGEEILTPYGDYYWGGRRR